MFVRASPEYFSGRVVCKLVVAVIQRVLPKVLAETLPALPCLVDQRCWMVCVVYTAILVVMSAGEQKMHSVARHVLHQQAFFNAAHPVIIYFVFAIELSLSVALPM